MVASGPWRDDVLHLGDFRRRDVRSGRRQSGPSVRARWANRAYELPAAVHHDDGAVQSLWPGAEAAVDGTLAGDRRRVFLRSAGAVQPVVDTAVPIRAGGMGVAEP